MRMGRFAALTAASLCTVTLLAGCGGSDEEPLVKPTSDASSSAVTDPDGFTPEQREVADAVQAYSDAFFGRGADPVETAVGDLITPGLRDGLVPAETKAIDDAGLQYIGDAVVAPGSVTIDGDTATYKGCSDASEVYVVKAGETTAGVGSRNVGVTRITYTLVRQDGRWLIDEPRGEQVPAC